MTKSTRTIVLHTLFGVLNYRIKVFIINFRTSFAVAVFLREEKSSIFGNFIQYVIRPVLKYSRKACRLHKSLQGMA